MKKRLGMAHFFNIKILPFFKMSRNLTIGFIEMTK